MAACWKVPILALACLFVANGTALASPASIDSVWVSNVTETDATLNAKIDPNGLYTAYEFQIDTNARYDYTQHGCPLSIPGRASCQLIVVGKPLPPGLVEPKPESIPAGVFGDQTVGVEMASIGATLRPETTYHYRVMASNGEEGGGGGVSLDQTFTTLSAPSSPPHVGSWRSTGSLPSAWTSTSSAVRLRGGDVLALPGPTGDDQSITPVLYDPLSGRWSELPALPALATSATPVALADGGALLVGGSACSGLLRRCVPVAFTARLNPSHSAWTSSTAMHEARANPAAVRLPDDRVLVAGGFGDNCPDAFAGGYSCHPLTSAEVFDPASGVWSMTSPMPRQPGATSATLLSDGTVLVAGDGKALRYLPRVGRWTTAGAPASAGGGSHLFSLPGDRALAMGGADGFFGSLGGAAAKPPPKCNPTSELFEGANDAWTISLTEPAGDTYCPEGAVLTGGQVLLSSVLNYSQSGATLTSPYMLDAKQRCWSKTAPPLEQRGGGTVVALRDGRGLVFGGYDASAPSSLPSVASAEIFTPGPPRCTATTHGASQFSGVTTSRRHRLTLTAHGAVRLLEECPNTASVHCVGHVALTLLVPPAHASGKRRATRRFLGDAPFVIPAVKPTWVTVHVTRNGHVLRSLLRRQRHVRVEIGNGAYDGEYNVAQTTTSSTLQAHHRR